MTMPRNVQEQDRRPTTVVRRIGAEGEPLAIIDDFAGDPDALRAAAVAATFGPADQHYPGIRAPLPDSYLKAQLPVIAAVLGRAFGRCRRVHVIDATFSIVTASPAALQLGQRLPHIDAYGPDRIALVHFLSPTDTDGTAFFRHRATGFETVTEKRAQAYFAQLDAEIRDEEPGPGYVADDSDLFERIAVVEARYNRALLYRSRQLHSGAISADAVLSADPAVGRLTVTAFLAIE